MRYAIFVLELIIGLSLFLNPQGAIKKPKSYWTLKRVRSFQLLGLAISIQSIIVLIVIFFI